MISYLQAAKELDERWTASLRFLPPTPVLRSSRDSNAARCIAKAEVDIFSRYAREVAADNGLRLAVLIEVYDLLLVTGLMSGIELNECRIGWREPTGQTRTASAAIAIVEAGPTKSRAASPAARRAPERPEGRANPRGYAGLPRRPAPQLAENPRKPRPA